MGVRNRVTVFVLLSKTGKCEEITGICTEISISSIMSEASGSMDISILNTPLINLRLGDEIQLNIDNRPFFVGKLFTIDLDGEDQYIRKYTFHDQSRYLMNPVSYSMPDPESLSNVFKIICERMGIAVGTVQDSGWLCGGQTFDNTTCNDIFMKLAEETLANTGQQFIWRPNRGKMELLNGKYGLGPYTDSDGIVEFNKNVLANIIKFNNSETIDTNTFNDIEFIQSVDGGGGNSKGSGTKRTKEENRAIYESRTNLTGSGGKIPRTARNQRAKIAAKFGSSDSGSSSGGKVSKKSGENTIGARNVTRDLDSIKQFGPLKKVTNVDYVVENSTIDALIKILREPTRTLSFSIICDEVLFTPGMIAYIGPTDDPSRYWVKSVTTNITNESITQDVETHQWQEQYAQKGDDNAEDLLKEAHASTILHTRYMEEARLLTGAKLDDFMLNSWQYYSINGSMPDTTPETYTISGSDWAVSSKPKHLDASSNVRYTSELTRGRILIGK